MSGDSHDREEESGGEGQRSVAAALRVTWREEGGGSGLYTAGGAQSCGCLPVFSSCA